MAVTYFPFNSIVVGGVPDRPANAETLAAYLAGFFSNGVLMQDDTALQVSASSGMSVQIAAGVGNINGKTIHNDAAEIITLEAASATLDRIDRIIFRLNEADRLMEFAVLKGTPASSPTAPEITQGAGIYEMCLAEIRIPAGATSITSSYITDKRSDASLCGLSSIAPHMQDIEHGGTGGKTAAAALENLGIKDYIVDEGVSGIWTYQKWASGKAELSGTCITSAAYDLDTAYGGMYYNKNVLAVSIPFELINPQETQVFATTIGSGLDLASKASMVDNVRVGTFWLNPTAYSLPVGCRVHFKIEGRWK